MSIGAIIIGDEILSGRRQDKHREKLIEQLSERGLRLSWAHYVGDDMPRLVKLFRETFSGGDTVFSFGGIGATPDDRTRQAVAKALGLEMALHPEAEREIRAQFGDEITDYRLQMGVCAQGSEIIPNPYNRIPGFSIREHYFVPGFPVMAWPMVEWVLDSRLGHLHHRDDFVERAIIVWEALEGRLVGLMEQLGKEFPTTTIFSLPSYAEGNTRRFVELGAKGPSEAVGEAMSRMQAEISDLGYEWQKKS